jgi:hypothetical protein
VYSYPGINVYGEIYNVGEVDVKGDNDNKNPSGPPL